MLRKILSTTGIRALNALAGILILYMATNELGKESWGIAGIILLDITLILLVIELMAGSGLVYFSSRYSLSSLMKIAYGWMALVIGSAGFVFSILSFFPKLYHIVIPAGYGLHILILSLLNALHGFNMNVLLGKKKIAAFNGLFLLQFCLQLLAFAVILYIGNLKDERSFVYALYVSYLIPAMIGWLLIAPFFKPENNPQEKASPKTILNYGSMTQLSSIAHMINKRLSYYFLKSLTGLGSVGVYTSGVQLTEGLRLIGQSISLVQFSEISNSNDRAASARLSVMLLKFSVVLTSLALIVLIAIPREIFERVFSKEFGDIKIVILSLAPGVIALAANTIFSHYFSGTGQPRYNLIASLTGLSVTVPSLIVLVPLYGLVGAGISASLAYTAAVVYQGILFRKQTHLGIKSLIITRHDLHLFRKAISRKK
ncbi:MAG: polysaccharide biosynthesis C-terminal domain-containing protein [Bacteroidetes bacterium]|nr:polysaccharide biosynthesis C-terminal domain-containing protein [Bacteroidota bacterium]